ncbi:MAG: PfkB family carbohydrate kinase [Planctomycetota bacterium]
MSQSGKIVGLDAAERLVRDARAAGEVVAMCHGCFDIVHPGHVRHLQQAARLADRLLVTITSDACVDKGTDRPLIPEELRVENLAALDCVDWVAVNPEPTAAGVLDRVRPDLYVKGREYEGDDDPRLRAERQTVEAYGGRVAFTSGDVVFSSTALIDALERRAQPCQAAVRRLGDQHDLDPGRLDRLVDDFGGQRVLVVGETIVDTYVMCDRPDVASEGPMMTLRPIEHRSIDGGAAIIARHLAAMGARPVLLTALPASRAGEAVRQRLALDGIAVRWIERPDALVEKQRFLVGTTKVMKLDLGGPLTLHADEQRQLIGLAAEAADGCDGVIVTDYGLGLLSPATLTGVCRAVRPAARLLVGDVSGRRSNLLAMREMDLLCPSEVEMRDALHDHDAGLSAVAWRLLHETRSRGAIVTLGAEGLIAFDGGPADAGGRLRAEPVPALAARPVDPLGCGDALLAAATLALGAGGTLVVAGLLGAVAAAAQSRQLGNTVVGATDLRRGLRRLLESRLTFDAEPVATWVSRSSDQLSAAHA